MKFKIAAGAEFDVLTRDELEKTLKSWTLELGRGRRFRRILGQGTVAATAVSIGGAASSTQLGPAEGFLWSVKRLNVAGLTGSDAVGLYINDANPGSLVQNTITAASPYTKFGSNELVLEPGDTLMISGTGLAATGVITLTGQVVETPVFASWQL